MIAVDEDQIRKQMVEALHEYGERFSMFVPHEQPIPQVLSLYSGTVDHKGRVDHRMLRHWTYYQETREFLKDRYAQFHVLETPAVRFDCLAGKLRKRTALGYGENGVFGNVKDCDEWYSDAIWMKFKGSQTVFECHSLSCGRNKCRLNYRVNRIREREDLFGLLKIFEGVNFITALSEIGKWFNLKFQPKASTGRSPNTYPRYAVSKEAVKGLLTEFQQMRHQHFRKFIGKMLTLLQTSEIVDWYPRKFSSEHAYLSLNLDSSIRTINSPAIKAHLWLLIRQEEIARDTRAKFRITDREMAEGLGVSATTAETVPKAA